METANAGNFEVGCNVEERNGTEAIKERRVKRFFLMEIIACLYTPIYANRCLSGMGKLGEEERIAGTFPLSG